MANYGKRDARRLETHLAAEAERSRPMMPTETPLCRVCGARATHAYTAWRRQEWFCAEHAEDAMS